MNIEITWCSPFPVEKIYAIGDTKLSSMTKWELEQIHKANTHIENYPAHMTYFDVFEVFDKIYSQLGWEIIDLIDRKYSSDTIDKMRTVYDHYFKRIVGVFINMGGVELLRTQPTPDHVELANRLEKNGI